MQKGEKMKNKTVSFALSILPTLLFTVGIHAANEDGKITIYSDCEKKYSSNLPTEYHIIPLSEGCSHKDFYLLREQTETIPLITYSISSNLCQYQLKLALDDMTQEFGPFTVNKDKSIGCHQKPPRKGVCKCVIVDQTP